MHVGSVSWRTWAHGIFSVKIWASTWDRVCQWARLKGWGTESMPVEVTHTAECKDSFPLPCLHTQGAWAEVAHGWCPAELCWTAKMEGSSNVLFPLWGREKWQSSSFTESWNWCHWPMSHVPTCHTHKAFKTLQGWGCHCCPKQPVPRLDSHLCEEIIPNNPIQLKPPLAQFEASSSPPVPAPLKLSPGCPLLSGVVQSQKVPSEPPELQQQAGTVRHFAV